MLLQFVSDVECGLFNLGMLLLLTWDVILFLLFDFVCGLFLSVGGDSWFAMWFVLCYLILHWICLFQAGDSWFAIWFVLHYLRQITPSWIWETPLKKTLKGVFFFCLEKPPNPLKKTLKSKCKTSVTQHPILLFKGLREYQHLAPANDHTKSKPNRNIWGIIYPTLLNFDTD